MSDLKKAAALVIKTYVTEPVALAVGLKLTATEEASVVMATHIMQDDADVEEMIPLRLAVKILTYSAGYSSVLKKWHIDVMGERIYVDKRSEFEQVLTEVVRYRSIQDQQKRETEVR